MTTILFLLAQLAAVSQRPQPVWVLTPVEHWSCPEHFYVRQGPLPECFPVTPLYSRMARNLTEGQELIHWGQVEVVPSSGKLRVRFPGDFIGQPGCEVIDKTDEKTNIVHFSDVSKEGFTAHAPAGHKLHLNCQGVIGR